MIHTLDALDYLMECFEELVRSKGVPDVLLEPFDVLVESLEEFPVLARRRPVKVLDQVLPLNTIKRRLGADDDASQVLQHLRNNSIHICSALFVLELTGWKLRHDALEPLEQSLEDWFQASAVCQDQPAEHIYPIREQCKLMRQWCEDLTQVLPLFVALEELHEFSVIGKLCRVFGWFQFTREKPVLHGRLVYELVVNTPVGRHDVFECTYSLFDNPTHVEDFHPNRKEMSKMSGYEPPVLLHDDEVDDRALRS